MNFIKFINNNFRGLFFVVFILMSLYSLYFIFYGLDLQDSFYHITKMINNDSYILAFLSYKVGYLWSLIFGKHIIGFRLFNLLLHLCMLVFPLLIIKPKRSEGYILLLLIVVIFVFFNLMNWNILGYDSFSFLSIIMLVCFLINYLKSKTIKNLLCVIFCASLSIAFRFPNIVLLPLLVAFLYYANSTNYLLKKHLFLSFLLIPISYLVLVAFNYGSLESYLIEFKKGLSATSQQHGVSKLIKFYLLHFGRILVYSFVILANYFIYKSIIKSKTNYWIFIFQIILVWYLYYKFIYGSGYSHRAALFLGSLVFTIILIELVNCWRFKKEIRNGKIAFVVILLLMFVPSIGSKSGLKYCGIFIVFLPYIYLNAELKFKSFFVVFLLLLSPFAIREKFTIKFMDAKQSELSSLYQLPMINGIYTTSNRKKMSDSIIKDYLKYKNYKKVFYGLDSYLFNYSLNNSPILFNTYTMDLNDIDEANNAVEIIKKNEGIMFFIVSSQLTESSSIFETKIINQNYKRVLKNGYSILIPLQEVIPN